MWKSFILLSLIFDPSVLFGEQLLHCLIPAFVDEFRKELTIESMDDGTYMILIHQNMNTMQKVLDAAGVGFKGRPVELAYRVLTPTVKCGRALNDHTITACHPELYTTFTLSSNDPLQPPLQIAGEASLDVGKSTWTVMEQLHTSTTRTSVSYRTYMHPKFIINGKTYYVGPDPMDFYGEDACKSSQNLSVGGST